MLERTPPPSPFDQVIMAVKDGIREARYAPGQRIIEPELMRALNVSRSSVREGLRRLAAEGFVEWQRFRGASIVRMSRRQVSDFMDLREVLEGFGAACAASRLETEGRGDIAKLQRARNARSQIAASYDAYNNEFHDLILRLSGNVELPVVLAQTRLPILRLQFNKILLSPEQIKISAADHKRVVAAILEKDTRAAEQAMRTHIRHSATCILSAPSSFFA